MIAGLRETKGELCAIFQVEERERKQSTGLTL